MSHAELIPESLVRRLSAQLGPLGVDVQLHVANVLEMAQRLPGMVENPAGLLVTWCQREADARQAQNAARERDRERYAELQIDLYRWVMETRPGPRLLARVLDQASREGYPALNRRTIERLRAMGVRWPAAASTYGHEGPRGAGARDACGPQSQGTRTGRSDVGAPSA
jgi:hypothetical protein